MARHDSGNRNGEIDRDEVDDRTMALGWYLRRLIKQEQERGVTITEIGRRAGITREQVSYIASDGRSAGFWALFKLAPYFRREPWELFREALEWWEKTGRAEAATEQQRRADEMSSRVEAAHRAKKKHSSGEQESVRLMPAAKPVPMTKKPGPR